MIYDFYHYYLKSRGVDKIENYSDYEDFCRKTWASLGCSEPNKRYFVPMYYNPEEDYPIWWYNICDYFTGLQRLKKFKEEGKAFFDFESFLDGKIIIMSLF